MRVKHNSRAQYFAGIERGVLRNSVIVVDPDNGLEVKRSNERHLLYSEAPDLFSRMSNDSILAIFHHFRRDERTVTLGKVSTKLEEECGLVPMWICDGEIAFFLLAKDDTMASALGQVLAAYAGKYPVLKRSTK